MYLSPDVLDCVLGLAHVQGEEILPDLFFNDPHKKHGLFQTMSAAWTAAAMHHQLPHSPSSSSKWARPWRQVKGQGSTPSSGCARGRTCAQALPQDGPSAAKGNGSASSTATRAAATCRRAAGSWRSAPAALLRSLVRDRPSHSATDAAGSKCTRKGGWL